MAFLDKIFGGNKTSGVKKFEPLVPTVNALEAQMKALSDADLKAKTSEFKAKLVGKTADEEKVVLAEILPEVFAVVREASRRTLGQRHFDVQLIGAAVLHSGAIAEMRTGEGKTLVATLPAYLNALTERGVHIITVNDYLSRRDAVWMGQIYSFLGLSIGVINHESSFVYDPSHRNQSEGSLSSSSAVGQQRNGKTFGANGDVLDKERDELGAFKVIHEFLRPV